MSNQEFHVLEHGHAPLVGYLQQTRVQLLQGKDLVLTHFGGLSCLMYITGPRCCQVAAFAVIEGHLALPEWNSSV